MEGEGRVHSECYEKYDDARAEKCMVCQGTVRKKEGFSGDFMKFESGVVHKVRVQILGRRIGDR